GGRQMVGMLFLSKRQVTTGCCGQHTPNPYWWNYRPDQRRDLAPFRKADAMTFGFGRIELRSPPFSRMVLAALLSFSWIIGTAPAGETADKQSRPNFLLIAVDDLNHWLTHLGRNRQVKTPNIDRLAKRGVTFTRAYCAAPACNPSRAALM